MQTFLCPCGQRLFFENSLCLNCQKQVGWCPSCDGLTSLAPDKTAGRFVCLRPGCGVELLLCLNYSQHNVCNRCLLPEEADLAEGLCDMCRLNDTIPDLSIPQKLELWGRLEVAKRRVLLQFQTLKLPPFDGATPPFPLSFDFLADSIPTDQGWRPMGDEKVYTGYAAGKITINILEADSVERERLRIHFGESHRSLVGHFRHELGHYLYDTRIAGSAHEEGFNQLFGDPTNPTYAEALKSYYKKGPLPDWNERFVSAYATMHPSEDWAETTAALLHGHAVLETAYQFGYFDVGPGTAPPETLIDRFIEFGIFLNEVNRDMGLLDVMPGVYNPSVRKKILFVRKVILEPESGNTPTDPIDPSNEMPPSSGSA